MSRSKSKSKKPAPMFVERLEDHCLHGRYIGLAAKYEFSDVPLHELVIPSGWARSINDDFKVVENDFTSRERALAWAKNENGFELSKHKPSIQKPAEMFWALVFEIGEIEEESFITIEGGCAATLTLDTTVLLVRPTAEEIAKITGYEEPKRIVKVA